MIQRIGIAVLVVLMTVGAAFGQGASGRVAGQVFDEEGNPLPGVQISLDAVGFKLSMDTKTNKKGKFQITVVDSTKDFVIRLEMEGYRPHQEPVDVPLGDIATKDFTLYRTDSQAGPAAGGAPTGVAEEPLSGSGAAIRAFNTGARAYNEQDFDAALASFQEATEHDPTLTQAWVIMSAIHRARADWPAALDASTQALASEPTNTQALMGRVDALHAMGQREASLEALDQLIAVDSSRETAVLVFNAAVAAVKAQDGEMALELFNKVVEIDPTLTPAHLVLARSYLEARKLEQARMHSDQIMAQTPDEAQGLAVRVEICKAQGDTACADEAMEALKTASPDELAEAYYNEGVDLFEAGDTQGAIAALEQALAANPDHPRAHYRLGMAYVSSGQNDKSKEHLSKFIELAPDDPEVGTAQEMLKYLE